MTPADVAENLTPKSLMDNAEKCLRNLIHALETAKEERVRNAKEVARLKAEKEAKLKYKRQEKEEEESEESAKEDVKSSNY